MGEQALPCVPLGSLWQGAALASEDRQQRRDEGRDLRMSRLNSGQGPEFDEFGGSTSRILITSDDSVSVGLIDARHRNKAPRSGDYEGRTVFGRKEQKA